MTKPILYIDIETLPSQDLVICAEIDAKYPLPILDLDGIKADGRLTDPAKIEVDIAKKTEAAVSGHADAVAKIMAARDEAWRKTATDGGKGHVATVGFAIDDGEVEVHSNPECAPFETVENDDGEDFDVTGLGVTHFGDISTDNRVLEVVREGETALLRHVFDRIELKLRKLATAAAFERWDAHNPTQDEAGRWTLIEQDHRHVQFVASKAEWIKGHTARLIPIFVAHFAEFDSRFLFQRALALGVTLPDWWPVSTSRLYEDRIQCTQQMWAGFGNRISLDSLCRALGVPGKAGFDGSMVWDAVKAGRIAEVAEYNKSDVRRLRSVHRRMRGLHVLGEDLQRPPLPTGRLDLRVSPALEAKLRATEAAQAAASAQQVA